MGANNINAAKGGAELASPVADTPDYCVTYGVNSRAAAVQGDPFSSVYNDNPAPENSDLIQDGLNAIKGIDRFADSPDRRLRRLSGRYDRVYGRWDTTVHQAEAEGISPRKHKRLLKKAERLEAKRERIEARDIRLDAIVDAAPALGLQDPSRYADARTSLLNWKQEDGNKLSRPKFTKEKWLKLAVSAYKHEENTRQETIAAQAALVKAGKEYNDLNGTYQRLQANQAGPGAIKSIREKITALLKNNPRLRIILDAAQAWGMKDPSYEEAINWIEEKLTACQTNSTTPTKSHEKRPAKKVAVKIEEPPADPATPQGLEDKALRFLNSVKMAEVRQTEPYSEVIALAYKVAARKMLDWGKAANDKEAYLKAAYCWGQAGEIKNATEALKKYKDLGGNEDIAYIAWREAKARCDARDNFNKHNYNIALQCIDTLANNAQGSDWLCAILICLNAEVLMGDKVSEYLKKYNACSSAQDLPKELAEEINFISEYEKLRASSSGAGVDQAAYRKKASKALNLPSRKNKDYFLAMAGFYYYWAGDYTHAYFYLSQVNLEGVSEAKISLLSKTVTLEVNHVAIENPQVIIVKSNDHPELPALSVNFKQMNRLKLKPGSWEITVRGNDDSGTIPKLEISEGDRTKVVSL